MAEADAERDARLALGPELQAIAVDAMKATLTAAEADPEEAALRLLDFAEHRERHRRATRIHNSELGILADTDKAYTDQQAAVRGMIDDFRLGDSTGRWMQLAPSWFENIRYLGIDRTDELALGRAFHLGLISGESVALYTARATMASILNHQLAYLAKSDQRFTGGMLTYREVYRDPTGPDVPYGFGPQGYNPQEQHERFPEFIDRVISEWLRRRHYPRTIPVDTPDKRFN